MAEAIFILWVVTIPLWMVVSTVMVWRKGRTSYALCWLLGALCVATGPGAVLVAALVPPKRLTHKVCVHCRGAIPLDAGVCRWCSWPQPGYVRQLRES